MIPIWDTLGMRTTRSQLMSLDDTLLRADRQCSSLTLDTPNPIGVGLPWLSIGVAEAALDALIAHASGRIIPSTDRPLSHMQWVQFDGADATVALDGAKLLGGRATWLADPAPFPRCPSRGADGVLRRALPRHNRKSCTGRRAGFGIRNSHR